MGGPSKFWGGPDLLDPPVIASMYVFGENGSHGLTKSRNMSQCLVHAVLRPLYVVGCAMGATPSAFRYASEFVNVYNRIYYAQLLSVRL